MLAPVPALALLAALASAASPPLAGLPDDLPPPEQAANPSTGPELGFFSARRLRFSLGVSYAHVSLNVPGANALGGGASVAHEWRLAEVALSLYGHGGFAAQDARARHTGPSTSYLRASVRVVPFPAWLRVMLEAGAQLGWDQAWSWCVASGAADQCGVVPARLSYAGVAGVVLVLPISSARVTLGFDALLHGPPTPQVCAQPGCRDAAIGNGTFGGQAWLEAGWGGLSW